MEYDNDRIIQPTDKKEYFFSALLIILYPLINSMSYFSAEPKIWVFLFIFSIFLFIVYYLFSRLIHTLYAAGKKNLVLFAAGFLFLILVLALITGAFKMVQQFELSYQASLYFSFSVQTFIRETIWTIVNLSIAAAIAFMRKAEEDKKSLYEAKQESRYYKLRYLRAQLNPHFLFNTLNSIYSLSLQKSDKTPEVVVKLADTVRYLIYECNEDIIPLNREIEFIRNYIEIEKIRHTADIRFTVEGNTDGIMIEPFIFISFIENGFKHAMDNSFDVPFIYINLKVSPENIVLNVINSSSADLEMQAKRINGKGISTSKNLLELLYPDSYDLNIIQTDKDDSRTGNLRLQHARERLENLYPDAYTLDVILSNSSFTVSLMLKTKAA
jgi:two-component system LytT family sensor kinase